MASATFRLGTAATNSAGTSWSWRAYDTAIDAVAASYVKLELQSTTGVRSIAVTIPSADETTMASSAIPTVTVNQNAKTAAFRCSTSAGRTYIVRAVINSGLDLRGVSVADYTKEIAVHRLTNVATRLLAVGETDQYSRTYGHTGKLNNTIRAAGNSGFAIASGAAPTPTVGYVKLYSSGGALIAIGGSGTKTVIAPA